MVVVVKVVVVVVFVFVLKEEEIPLILDFRFMGGGITFCRESFFVRWVGFFGSCRFLG